MDIQTRKISKNLLTLPIVCILLISSLFNTHQTMKARKTLTLLLGCAWACYHATAQTTNDSKEANVGFQKTIEAYQDSLAQTKAYFEQWKYEGSDTLSNPYYHRLFFQNGLSDDVFSETIGTLSQDESNTSSTRRKNNYISELITETFTDNPNNLKNYLSANVSSQASKNEPTEKAPVEAQKPQKAEQTLKPVDTNEFDGSNNLVVKKPNFWTFKGNASLQFMQAHFSDNWYKGGDDNNTLQATCNLEANYDNKQGFIWTNYLEMKIGFQNSKGDDLHDFKTNTDLIRLTNKVGLKASKSWYYTTTLQSWTQFYKGYRANDPMVYSDFMSPFESLLSVGMDYKLEKKKFSCGVSLSPFAGKFKYCDRKNLVNNYGLKDKHSRLEFGSNITTTFKWTITKDINWSGRIYYFTDYDKSQIEWENTINLRVNKYLSTKLYLYPRFDDSAPKRDGKSYFQFHETLTLGLDVSF